MRMLDGREVRLANDASGNPMVLVDGVPVGEAEALLIGGRLVNGGEMLAWLEAEAEGALCPRPDCEECEP